MRLTLTSVQVVKFIALFVPDVWLALFPSTVRSARARLLLLDALRTDTLAAATRLRTVTPMPWPWRTRLLTSAIDAAMLNVPSLSTTLPPPAGGAATFAAPRPVGMADTRKERRSWDEMRPRILTGIAAKRSAS